MPNTREKLIERLPVYDAIRIFREEFKHRSEAYTTHLSYGGKGDPAEEVYIDALEMATSALEQTRWIPVTERLPNGKKIIDGEEYIKNVAIRIKDDAPEKIAFYDEEEKCWFDTEFFPVAGEVTHWCELPEPPKGE